jgi:hypothetical protein
MLGVKHEEMGSHCMTRLSKFQVVQINRMAYATQKLASCQPTIYHKKTEGKNTVIKDTNQIFKKSNYF